MQLNKIKSDEIKLSAAKYLRNSRANAVCIPVISDYKLKLVRVTRDEVQGIINELKGGESQCIP